MSHRALSPEQFKFVPASSTVPEASGHHHVLSHRELPKTSLIWHKDTGHIFGVQVAESHQRQGIATAMWEHAHSLSEEHGLAAPRHSPIAAGKGDKWARAVGGELPQRDLEKSYRGDE